MTMRTPSRPPQKLNFPSFLGCCLQDRPRVMMQPSLKLQGRHQEARGPPAPLKTRGRVVQAAVTRFVWALQHSAELCASLQ